METRKMSKPLLKNHKIKTEPSLPFKKTPPKNELKKTPPKNELKKDSGKAKYKKIEMLQPELRKIYIKKIQQIGHIIGKGMIGQSIYYLVFGKNQKLQEARWVDAHFVNLTSKHKQQLLTSLQRKISLMDPNFQNKFEPFVDKEYLQEYFESRYRYPQKTGSIKIRREKKIHQKFLFLFFAMKYKINALKELKKCDSIRDKGPQQNLSILKVWLDQNTTSHSQGKKIVLQQESAKIKQEHIEEIEKAAISFSNVLTEEFDERIGLTKKEVIGVRLVGKIKETPGALENLYKFVFLYHQDIYCTFKTIKTDTLLSEGFMKFAELLYEKSQK